MSDCGDTAIADVGSFIIKALKVRITTPARDPVSPAPPIQNNFSFDKAAHPNAKCTVSVIGNSCVSEEDAKLKWSLADISGATLSCNPSDKSGGSATYTYITLPLANYFGRKSLTLNHPLGCGDSFYVDVFFSGDDDAVNHPGFGSGYTPNWFYYWNQTSAHWAGATIYYNPTFIDQFLGQSAISALGLTYYVAGQWRCYMHSQANDNSNVILEGPATVNGKNWKGERLSGIDSFAEVWRHEARHKTVFDFYWPAGPVPGQSLPGDADDDLLPDAIEGLLGAEVGGPFSPLFYDTDGDGFNDGHDYVYWTQATWNIGSADSQDWSHFAHAHQYYDY